MKKLLALTFLLVASSAFAQTYVGGKVGGNNLFVGVGLSETLDVRVDADFFLTDDLSRFDLGADVLVGLPSSTSEAEFYVGGGPSVGYTSVAGDGEFDIYLQGLGGAEYKAVTNKLGLFGELGLQSRLTNGFTLYPFVQTGVNFYF